MNKWPKLIASVGICLMVGAVASQATAPAIPEWYQTLNKPFFSPPNWLFAPVWTALYISIGISWYLVWKQGWAKPEVAKAGYFFAAQLLLNFLWSFSFFGLRSPPAGID
jgi:translocator protein